MRLFVGLLAAMLACGAGSVTAADLDKKKMTLEECVSIALSGHPKIAEVQGRVSEARGRLDAVKGAKLPQVGFEADAQRYDRLPANKANIIGGGSTDVYSSISIRQLLFSNGRAEAEVDSASASVLASREDMRRIRQEVAFGVAVAYYNLLKAQAINDASDEAVGQMEHHLDVAREKMSVGKAARLDVLRAEVQLADVTQSRIAAANRVEIAGLQLLNAMGTGSSDGSVAIADDRSPAASVSEVAPLMDRAFRVHPEYLRAEDSVKASESNLRAARGDSGPELSMVASYNREGKDIPDITNWNAGVVITMPIFTGGITRAKVDQARAVVQQNSSSRDLVRQSISLAVRSAVLATQDASERLKATLKGLEQAKEALAVAQEKYAAGLGSTTEVIDTQVALTQAETNYADALYGGKIAQAQLDYAIGNDPIVGDTSGGNYQ